jgi:hypothetical protein
VAWGFGTGMWIDMEAKICNPTCDPALVAIPPVVFAAAAPVGVWLVDRFAFSRGMPEGLPSAIAAGMWIGAGEAMGAASYQMVSAPAESAWGFRGLTRAELLGSTLGGAAGVGLYYALKPAPETNIFLLSSTFWGTGIGAFFGGGASPRFSPWKGENQWSTKDANDYVFLGGLIGFNIALAGATTASIFWTPSWNQVAWMWGGFGLGTVASLPVYIFYAAVDTSAPNGKDPRRGLIFQGVAATLGTALGGILGKPRRKGMAWEPEAKDGKEWGRATKDRPVALLGGGITPMEGGLGLTAVGTLW